ncbi:MAG: hypothetical protein MZV64_23975 [Ignavibacteriales bacterium]|nr:hypothetical protein [Ignavibacteriales bacterium]
MNTDCRSSLSCWAFTSWRADSSEAESETPMRRDNIFWEAFSSCWARSSSCKEGVLSPASRISLAACPHPLWRVADLERVLAPSAPSESEKFDVALRGAKSVRYRFSHGAGQIVIKGGGARLARLWWVRLRLG